MNRPSPMRAVWRGGWLVENVDVVCWLFRAMLELKLIWTDLVPHKNGFRRRVIFFRGLSKTHP